MTRDLSFVKEERLKNSRDFKRVYSEGKRIRTKNFIVYALPNGLGLPRLGLAVSAKTANSPGRSRIKRLLREFFRLNKTCFVKQPPCALPQGVRGHTGRNKAGFEEPNPPCGIKTVSNKEKTFTAPVTSSAPPAGYAVSTGHDVPGSEADALDVVISLKNPAAIFGFKDIKEELTGALLKLTRTG
jgi:RNase P protein component